jgi:ABC-type maltose transport system permease subunit
MAACLLPQSLLHVALLHPRQPRVATAFAAAAVLVELRLLLLLLLLQRSRLRAAPYRCRFQC